MSYRVEKDVMVPMRDGQTLATDLWIPDAGPAPALLVRTPYGKDVPNLLAEGRNVRALLEAGHAGGTCRSYDPANPVPDTAGPAGRSATIPPSVGPWVGGAGFSWRSRRAWGCSPPR